MLDPEMLLRAYDVPDRAVPTLRANFIVSLDGASTAGGLSGGLNDAWDEQVFDTLRRLCDVVVVGAGTARREGYAAMRLGDDDVAWRQAHGLPDHPVLALATRSLDLDPAHAMFTDAPRRPLVLTCTSAPADRRAALGEVADVVDCGTDGVEAGPLRAALADRGLPQALCEGGPSLLGTLLDGDALDELCLTIAPALVGGDGPRLLTGAAEQVRRMRRVHAIEGGPMLFLRYARDRTSDD